MTTSPIAQLLVRPVCSKCGAPLWLIRIQPDKRGCARRSFECPRCQNQISEVIELEKTRELIQI